MSATSIPNPFYRSLLWLTACVLICADLSAGGGKRIRFDRLTIEDGLPQSSIQAILQDRYGFLWIGTQAGLSKYDGYSFTNYKYDPLDQKSLSANQVGQIFEQRDGTFWVGVNGIFMNRFDRETETFTRFGYNPADPYSFGDAAFSQTSRMAEDRQGRLWVGTFGGGLRRFDAENERWIHYRNDPNDPNTLSDDNITALVVDRNGELWVGTNGGLNRIDPETGRVVRYLHDPDNVNTLGSNAIPPDGNNPGILLDDHHTLWVTTAGYLNHLDPDSGRVRRFVVDPDNPELFVGGILEDSLGYLWVKGFPGLYRFDRSKETFTVFKHNPQDSDSLSQGNTLAIHEDREGNLWVGLQLGGLNLYDRTQNRFRKFKPSPSDPYSIGTNTVTGIFADNSGSLWFGSFDNGLSKYCPEKQKFPHYLHPYVEPAPLTENLVWGIHESRDKLVWIGTRSEGLVGFDLETDRIVHQYQNDPKNPTGIPPGNVWSITEDQSGDLYISMTGVGGPNGALVRMDRKSETFERVAPWAARSLMWDRDGNLLAGGANNTGLGIYNPTTGEQRLILNDPNDPNNYAGPLVWSMLEEEHYLWLATLSGLRRYHRDNGELVTYLHNVNDPTSLSHNNVMATVVDRSGQFWAGTFGGGLNLMDRDTGTFIHFTMRHGLPDDAVYGILLDDDGMLWLSTNRGLCRFNPQTYETRNYDRSDGLQSNEFDAVSYHKSPDGRLYFGGVNGFNAFYPQNLRDNLAIPLVVVSASKNVDEHISSELENDETIVLGPSDNLIEFRFTALDYTHSKRNRYAYKLEGFDDDWVMAGTRRSTTYTNLDSGWYRLRVKGSNSDGTWNESGSTVNLHVEPPFWETWWFYSLTILAALALLALGFMMQLGRMQRRSEDELRAMDLKRKSEELEYARKIQLGMLPEKNISAERVEVVGQMITATEVGGDYFDFFDLGNDRLCIAYGDATGHGMAAGLIVGMVKMASTVWSLNPGVAILDMMSDLNTGLRKSIPAQGMGMGFGLALLDLKANRAELCAGGMPYPLHWNAAENRLEPIVLKGPPLGFLRKISVPRVTVDLHQGDYLIFLSDGFNERFNPQDKVWGDAALTETLAGICRTTKGAHAVVHGLTEACHRFAAGRKNDDDMTIVVVRIRQKSEQARESAADPSLSMETTGPLS